MAEGKSEASPSSPSHLSTLFEASRSYPSVTRSWDYIELTVTVSKDLQPLKPVSLLGVRSQALAREIYRKRPSSGAKITSHPYASAIAITPNTPVPLTGVFPSTMLAEGYEKRKEGEGQLCRS
jgi:hypothetical protein